MNSKLKWTKAFYKQSETRIKTRKNKNYNLNHMKTKNKKPNTQNSTLQTIIWSRDMINTRLMLI